MKNYLLVALLLIAVLFTGCRQTDVAHVEELSAPADSNGETVDENLPTGTPAEWEKVVVAYEKDGRIMLAEGKNPPRAVTGGPNDSNPLLSPDGKHLLFTITYYDEREGFDGVYEGSYYDLWLVDIDGRAILIDTGVGSEFDVLPIE